MSCFRWLALLVVIVAALFGVHTPGMGYDDDDLNRVSLVRDYPRPALNAAPSQASTALDRPTPLDREPVAALAAAPVPLDGLHRASPFAAWQPRATPRRGPPAAHPRAPPPLA
jgi:hypothetical protein